MKKNLLITFLILVSPLVAQEENEKVLDSLINALGTFQNLEEIVLTSGVIDLAEERATPIAVSTISAKEILLKVGNQEFPEIMNNTPGVYATKQGGGYGDSRISLRGFDQTNTSFLINGQPVNDIFNSCVTSCSSRRK